MEKVCLQEMRNIDGGIHGKVKVTCNECGALIKSYYVFTWSGYTSALNKARTAGKKHLKGGCRSYKIKMLDW